MESSGARGWKPDIVSMEFISNPYPVYRRIRAASPVYLSDDVGGYMLTRHQDCDYILSNPSFGKDFERRIETEISRQNKLKDGDSIVPFSKSMLFLDPPNHTRLRQLVSKAFTPGAVERIRPFVENLARDLLRSADRREYDIMNEYAGPLPAFTIARMLGVPSKDMKRFKEWSEKAVLSLDATRPREDMIAAARATSELGAYFASLIDERRNSKSDDLLNSLISAEESGDRLNREELLSMCILLLIAGHETTTNLIGNGFLALMRNREQMQLLCDDRSLLRSAIEEFLRYDPPVQMVARGVMADSILSGHPVSSGSKVIAVIGAANRDPEVFENPDRLDITRKNNRHLSFSKGIHYCLGAQLAKLEGEIAINALLDRMPNARIAQEPVWRNNANLRGMESLLVTT
ncbi:MAG: cytochrome P450 [Thermoplasmata archaeon YP2-bin.285]|uniref:Cytochrome P450 n=1 Tax=Candidatus Sysuiplasma superficiale TaxID=2823368 RepID=A0A8J8CC42_9ARCH|nr:cytochrome P450 [Candidatus Sysuiplasma superficiale]